MGTFSKYRCPDLIPAGRVRFVHSGKVLQVTLMAPEQRTSDLQGLTQVTASISRANTRCITSNPYLQTCPAFFTGAICTHCNVHTFQSFVGWEGEWGFGDTKFRSAYLENPLNTIPDIFLGQKLHTLLVLTTYICNKAG